MNGRRRVGLRARIFWWSVALVLLGGTAAGVWLERGLRHEVQTRSENELIGYARAAALWAHESQGDEVALDALADRLGATMAVRVTFIAADGAVLGDSDVALPRLQTLENHGQREEVVDARRLGSGLARRDSSTLGRALLYVAVRGSPGDRVDIVRVARPLDDERAALRRLRGVLFGSGGVLILMALSSATVASWQLSRETQRLVGAARDLVPRRAQGARLTVHSTDELGRLAEAFNHLLDDLDANLDALRSERARSQAVLEGMSEAVIALDERGCVELCNPAALELLRLEETPLGTPLADLLDRLRVEQIEASTDAEGRTIEWEIDEEPPRRLLARERAQPDGSGSVLVLLDVSRLRRLEKLRKDFVANVSHELRTPVAVLQANAETLLDGALEEPEIARRFTEAIHRQAIRLTSLVNDLLDISRIEAGRYELEPEEVPVSEAVQGVAETLQRAITEKGMTLAVEVPEGLLALSDPKAFDQILRNLLENAVKYTPAGGHLGIVVGRIEERVRVEVRDDGPGIQARHRPRLFERFYRVDKGRSRDMGGTGLGLSIAKHLAEAQGGAIGHEPVEPHGSCFWFELPAA